jgi:osomolarity two-component system sensor histidine kinase NIK1
MATTLTMGDTSSMEAIASILKGLARNINLRQDIESNHGVKLPGVDTEAKIILEFEIAALIARVQTLEARLIMTNKQAFPDTPNEFGSSVAYADMCAGDLSPNAETVASSHQSVNLSILFSDGLEERPQKFVKIDEDLEILREITNDQSKQLDSQKSVSSTVDDHLLRQRQLQVQAVSLFEVARISTLERELKKHQQANEAFQKALREIGEIITAVARGDLSKKLQIHSIEMDPEITTFKRVWRSTTL